MNNQIGSVKSTSGSNINGYRNSLGEWISYFIPKEDTDTLQQMRNRLFKQFKVKKGRAYQLNAYHSFKRAIDKCGDDLNYEKLFNNFFL